MIARRQALKMLAGGVLCASFPRLARASLARALTLDEMVGMSERIVAATPLEARSRWERVGDRRRIVTTTRIGVDRGLDDRGDGDELLVRTLGGRVGKIGQIVHGEAILLVGRPAVLFLARSAAGRLAVAGMAQGHYPVVDAKLVPSPGLAKLYGDDERSTVRALAGKSVGEAHELVRNAGRRR